LSSEYSGSSVPYGTEYAEIYVAGFDVEA